MKTRTALVCLLLTFFALSSKAQTHNTTSVSIPTPTEVLGFTPGDDRKLANWKQVLDYFGKLDASSDRVRFETLGKTTMNLPFVMATISHPENLLQLDQYRNIQQKLADPRKLGPLTRRDREAARLITRGKTIVLITCGIHSTEVGSYLSSMLIAYRLASSNEPEIQNILRNTIILLVPSLNPDGVDIVKNWYDRTLGTPYEGTDPPELYHKFVGHDDNRDWYAFTQVETQIAVSKIHNVWHPQIVHDIHQQGQFGSRLFLPPYMQPVEPNVPKQIVAAYTELGKWMASELRREGFQGITTNSTYDAWTPARAYSHYHGGVRILSETASARIASPTTIKFEELRSRDGYDAQKESSNFGPVWKGGEWHLRDITNYMTAAAFTLLQHAAENREQWLRRFYQIGSEAVRPKKPGELTAFRIEADGGWFNNLYQLTSILEQAGVTVEFTRDGVVVALDQPYESFARAMLQPEMYPDLRDENGKPLEPYDVTAHTLALLMGVKVTPIKAPFKTERLRNVEVTKSDWQVSAGRVGLYKSRVPSMDEGWTRWIFTRFKPVRITTSLMDAEIRGGNLNRRYDAVIIPDQQPDTILNGYARGKMPEEFTGGLGPSGVEALKQFVEAGGTLVCLNRASQFAIDQFKLPIHNVVANLPASDFYVPGSILRLELDNSHPLTRGMSQNSIAWVEESPVFEIEKDATNVQVIGRYPRNANPLLSGWLLGSDKIQGKAALVEVKIGRGRIILFGFRPQYRGQSLATYPLLFNSLWYGIQESSR